MKIATASLRAVNHPSLAYVVPFAVFWLFLVVAADIPVPLSIEQPIRVAVLAAVIWGFSRQVLDLRSPNLLESAGIGVAVFLIWIAPDVLFPGYRQSIVFQNFITGQVHNSIPPEMLTNPVVLWSRIIRAVIIVPIVEELFWRGWLMRWLISHDFEAVPLGAYAPQAFWITAVLFASEHGPYWDVGLIAGAVYNWWVVRTKNLGNCILAHSITNACLCGYVVATHRWDYWM